MVGTEKTHGNLTEGEYSELVKAHGKLTSIVVGEDTAEPIWFHFKKPDMKTYSAAAAMYERDPVAASQVFFKNCLVHGDAKYADDVEVLPSIAPLLQQLIQKKTASIKNF